MRIFGSIHYVDISNRIIGIKQNKSIHYFYLKNSLMQLFKRYLYVNNYIDLEYHNNPTIKHHKNVNEVELIYSIYSNYNNNKIIYYDKSNRTIELKRFLNSFDNIMVLDLEMTMPPYGYKGQSFKTEIIQAGFILYDKKENIIKKYSNYIKPVIAKKISNRTEKFLEIDNKEFQNKAIDYKDFYSELKKTINKYHPAILVYGKNDIIVLNNSYIINELPSLKNKTRFVNVCNLIKDYYNLKQDPGLFKLYDIYNNSVTHQDHNAYSDSYITLQVFKFFRDEVNQRTNRTDDIKRELE